MTAGRNPKTREDALTTAARRFVNNGYAKTSMNSIAEDIGIAAPSLYWHFKSKEEILFCLLERELERFISVLEEGSRQLPASDRMEAMVRRYLLVQLGGKLDGDTLDVSGSDTESEARIYSRLVQIAELDHVLTVEHGDRVRGLQRRVYSLFKDTLTEGADQGVFHFSDAGATAFAITTLCESVLSWARPGGRLGPGEVVEYYVDLVRKMIA